MFVLCSCCAVPVLHLLKKEYKMKKKPYSCRAVLALQLQCAVLYGFFKTANFESRWHGTCVRTAQKRGAVFRIFF